MNDVTYETVHEWVKDNASKFTYDDDDTDDTMIDEDKLMAAAMKKFADKVPSDIYIENNCDPTTEAGRTDFFSAIVCSVVESYY